MRDQGNDIIFLVVSRYIYSHGVLVIDWQAAIDITDSLGYRLGERKHDSWLHFFFWRLAFWMFGKEHTEACTVNDWLLSPVYKLMSEWLTETKKIFVGGWRNSTRNNRAPLPKRGCRGFVSQLKQCGKTEHGSKTRGRFMAPAQKAKISKR